MRSISLFHANFAINEPRLNCSVVLMLPTTYSKGKRRKLLPINTPYSASCIDFSKLQIQAMNKMPGYTVLLRHTQTKIRVNDPKFTLITRSQRDGLNPHTCFAALDSVKTLCFFSFFNTLVFMSLAIYFPPVFASFVILWKEVNNLFLRQHSVSKDSQVLILLFCLF